MTKRPVIIDTDPGIDDAAALAIALFHEDVDVQLITTVNGNVSLEKVTYNALKLLKLFDKEVPVAKGASKPLIAEPEDASSIHGETGMDGYDFAEPDDHLLVDDHAVNAMYKAIINSEDPVTLVTIAPLTNVALLFHMYPDVKANIADIIMMGGSTGRGNATVTAEFNIYADPEAAKMVFTSGLPIVMAGLDVGPKALVYPEDSEMIKNMNETGYMLYHLFKKYRGDSFKNGLKMYDSCAIAYLLKPDIFETQDAFVDIELDGQLTKGTTVVNLNNSINQANVKVCTDLDSDGFKQWFLANLEKCR